MNYHSKLKRFHVQLPDNLDVSTISEIPTAGDIEFARAFLVEELLENFPFVEPSDRANMLAAILLPFAQPFIEDFTPMHLFDSDIAGLEEPIVADIVSLIATGKPATVTELPTSEKSQQRAVAAVLDAVDPVAFFYHPSGDFPYCSALETVLTHHQWVTWKPRTYDKQVHINNKTWLMGGIRQQLPASMRSRIIRIWLQTPGSGVGFERDLTNITAWVQKNRIDLIGAILTIIHAWIDLGKPSPQRLNHRFVKWSQVIGGMLEVVKIPGFLDDWYAQEPCNNPQVTDFLTVWWEKFGDHKVRVSELARLCRDNGLLGNVLQESYERSRLAKLEKFLFQHTQRMNASFQIEEEDEHQPVRESNPIFHLRMLKAEDGVTINKHFPTMAKSCCR